MSIDKLYKLRKDFLVIGLTGRMGGGCNNVCDFLTKASNPFTNQLIPLELHKNEIQKYRICKDLITHPSNIWEPFKVIKYKDVLLLFFLANLHKRLSFNYSNLSLTMLVDIFDSIIDKTTSETPRLGQEIFTEKVIENAIFPYLQSNIASLQEFARVFNFHDGTPSVDSSHCAQIQATEFNQMFFGAFSDFCEEFYLLIDKCRPDSRQLFLQDLACNLRSCGHVEFEDVIKEENIYLVADLIKEIIKINKQAESKCRIIIDSLKNSSEINYFRERYSGFYLLASNREPNDVQSYITNKIDKLGLFTDDRKTEILKLLRELDEINYDTGDFKSGNFTVPDLENCIQKADYYTYLSATPSERMVGEFYHDPFELQILKFLALAYKPGIVTPSALERNMQLAFSSKYNSGCISRQVGAVITDVNYSVKAIGWNEVPQGQTPCSLRSIKDLITLSEGDKKKDQVYTHYEKFGGSYNGVKFIERVKETLSSSYPNRELFDNLDGHNCPFCFKDFHNSFDGKDNQVHTRSLHAEENAMLQIAKFGGQPLKDGNLFTTASPCELCSKKAYQLGIKNIFYIDPYPGIARQQILNEGSFNGIHPKLFIFHGAVGRGYFKLYESYLSLKDETKLRTAIIPKKKTPDFSKITKDLDLAALEKLEDEIAKRKLGLTS